MHRSWFIAPRAPNFDCEPNGYLSLGSIVRHPLDPDQPITSGLPKPLPDSVHVVKIIKEDWKLLKGHNKQGKIGIWAQFLDFIKLDEAGANWNTEHIDEYAFKTLELDWFVPPHEFLRQRMEEQEVAKYTSAGTFRPPVYMITAVMTVRGAAITQNKDNHTWGLRSKVGVDLTAVSAPSITIGEDIAFSSGTRDETSTGNSSDFVFAYRMSKVTYKWKGGVKLFQHRPVNKGGAFGVDADDEQREEEPKNVDLDTIAIRSGDVSAEDLKQNDGIDVRTTLATAEIEDAGGDEGLCECILLE